MPISPQQANQMRRYLNRYGVKVPLNWVVNRCGKSVTKLTDLDPDDARECMRKARDTWPARRRAAWRDVNQ